MAIPPSTGGIFGQFTGGAFVNQLQFNPGLTAGQVVPSNPAFNPAPLFQPLFGAFPYAANSLTTSQLIALTGGGPPLIASFPTVSPFTNPLLNLFNPATAVGQGGLAPGTAQAPATNAGVAQGVAPRSLAANGNAGTAAPGSNFNFGSLASLGGLGNFVNLGLLG